MEKKEAWYSKKVDETLFLLNTTLNGLNNSDIEKRQKQNGLNEITEKKKDSAIKVFARQFKSLIIYILIAAAIISASFGNEIETIVIICIIGFIVIISFIEEYKASRDMEALQKLTSKKAKVIREGKKEEILSRDLVPGDIILVERGNIVPADARLIEANNIQVDESALTGESVAVNKMIMELKGDIPVSGQLNMIFSGSLVLNGNAKAIVVRTGKETEMGKISSMIANIREEATPLQKRMDKMTRQISFGVFVLCAIIFALGLMRGQDWHKMLLLTLGVLVSGIPESVPTVIAVTLALGVKKMAKRKAIVKRLPAVETLGATTVICTDKTGTLTQNKMVIENIFTLDSEVNITGAGFSPEGIFLKEDREFDPKKHKTISKLIEIGVLCNNANLKQEDGEWKVEGETTEGALVVLAKKAGIHKEQIDKNFKRIKEHPFDPIRKCMSTVHVTKNQPIVYSKGAPELLLKKSKYYLFEGKIKSLTKKEIDAILARNQEYAKKGLRVLGLAYKEHKGKTLELHHVENGLIFVGLVSIRDPPGPDVKESIAMCKEAGIRVVMITGDNENTAKAIAAELGIYSPENLVMTGAQIDAMPALELQRIIDHITVFARVTPEHKLKIVSLLQQKGHIVAMTGDGVNDAPALKKADIGIAMGKRGTEVAKESAEMIILDDNFTTIANAVKEGRTIFSNIRKFIYFALTGGFAEVILILVSILLNAEPVLTALMILFVNLVTGDLPSFGLSQEDPDKNIMKQRPRNIKEGILSDFVLLKIAEPVPLMVFGTIGIYMWEIVMKGGTDAKAQTMAFATIIFFELFHVYNARSWDESLLSKKFFSNYMMLAGVAASAIATIIVIQWQPAQRIFGTVGLNLGEWAIIIAMASSILIYREIEKTVVNAEIKEREKTDYLVTREEKS